MQQPRRNSWPSPGKEASTLERATSLNIPRSGDGSLRAVGLAGRQHGVHSDSQVARDQHGGALEVEPLKQLQLSQRRELDGSGRTKFKQSQIFMQKGAAQ